MNALHSKNKARFIDGTIEKPDVTCFTFQTWKQCNAVVLSCFTNVLNKVLEGTATHVETTREVWKDIEDKFTQGIAPRVYELKLKHAIALLQ